VDVFLELLVQIAGGLPKDDAPGSYVGRLTADPDWKRQIL
jgi:hypothetical protein